MGESGKGDVARPPFYFGLDVFHACNEMLRALHELYPRVLDELRALPVSDFEFADTLSAADARRFASVLRRTREAQFAVLTPLSPLALLGHEVRQHAAVLDRMDAALAAPTSREIVQSLSRGELRYAVALTRWSQRWRGAADLHVSDRTMGVRWCLAQRLTLLREGFEHAETFGPLPARSPLDADDSPVVVEEKKRRHPEYCVIIPPAVSEWATSRMLGSTALQGFAVLLRAMWERHPSRPLPLPTVPSIAVTTLVRGIFHEQIGSLDQLTLRIKALQRQIDDDRRNDTVPAHFIEELEAKVKALSAKRRQVRDALRVGRPSLGPVPTFRHLSRHARWLVQVQVGGRSPAEISEETEQTGDRVHRKAVDNAVRNTARLLGLTLRELPNTGRPTGVREKGPRRRRALS